MSTSRIEIGRAGEDAAVDFLRRNGYKIVERNFKNKLGEIDVIARDSDTLCFIEVKTRTSFNFGYPQDAVTVPKQKKINRVALSYLKQYNLLNISARFDIVSVVSNNQNKFDIEIIKDAFSS
ncbi:YraN family protein [Candidatus Omnitrophota bacterium]